MTERELLLGLLKVIGVWAAIFAFMCVVVVFFLIDGLPMVGALAFAVLCGWLMWKGEKR